MADIAWADTVILQRDSNRYVLGLVDILQKMGKRVIFDMDDLLTEIPLFLHHMMNPSTYRSALHVLRREGISGVRTRLSRLF